MKGNRFFVDYVTWPRHRGDTHFMSWLRSRSPSTIALDLLSPTQIRGQPHYELEESGRKRRRGLSNVFIDYWKFTHGTWKHHVGSRTDIRAYGVVVKFYSSVPVTEGFRVLYLSLYSSVFLCLLLSGICLATETYDSFNKYLQCSNPLRWKIFFPQCLPGPIGVLQ